MEYTLHCGDNRDVLRTMADASVDSIVCDPPYELGFMGKHWDSTGIAYDVTLWTECLRVLKPGGHLIAFGGSRTYHRLAVAIEDAGFEIRDQIQWIYGSGFPKSLDVSKAMDKQAGAERSSACKPMTHNYVYNHGKGKAAGVDRTPGAYLSEPPITDIAKAWHGWGTALKPAHEPAVLARKPLVGTVADNVMTWGVGALNIDGCRVPSDDGFERAWDKPVKTNIANGGGAFGTGESTKRGTKEVDISANKPMGGRWPANVIFDEEAAQVLDGQSGGASRFFYVAKASKAEREAGLDSDGDRANHHPTVKPIDLMRCLVRLVTPKGGTVLDPFMGSGSTGCAVMLEGMDFVGIDITPEYVEIARRRILHHANQNPMGL